MGLDAPASPPRDVCEASRVEAHFGYGTLAHVDIVGIHAFPGMWWPGERNWDWHDRWHGWENGKPWPPKEER